MENIKARTHLVFLEGLRGAAALYVVMHHAMLRYDLKPTSLAQKLLIAVFNHGHFAVNLFIVISGFSLMLPSIKKEYEVDTLNFYKRRIRRILPPYYFALVLSIFLIPMYLDAGSSWTESVSFKSIALHVLLVNDFFSSDVYTLNYSLWSIPVECRIYLFFPLLLLVWRKAGPWLALSLAVILSAILGITLVVLSNTNPDINITTSGVNPYIILFALGMLAADLSFSDLKRDHKMVRIPWIITLLVSFGVFIAYKGSLQYKLDVTSHMHDIIADVLFGIVCFALLGICSSENYKHNILKYFEKMFSWRPLVFMGMFSYSIYLIHAPVLEIIYVQVMPLFKLSPFYASMTLIIMGTIFIVALGYVFFLIFEKPYLSRKRKEVVAEIAPADIVIPVG
jgi:peptidoglycan/LPS O-acetylase OafA/YrhL